MRPAKTDVSSENELIARLPVFVARKVFCTLSGLSRYQVAQLRASGHIRHWLPPGRAGSPKAKGKYYREDLLRIIGAQ